MEDAQTGHSHQLPQVLLHGGHAPQHGKAVAVSRQTHPPVQTTSLPHYPGERCNSCDLKIPISVRDSQNKIHLEICNVIAWSNYQIITPWS